MTKKNVQQPAPPGSIVLTPATLAFSLGMLVLGAVGGYVVGSNGTDAPGDTSPSAQADSSQAAEAPQPSAAAAAAPDKPGKEGGLQGEVVNDTRGQVRRLSEDEKANLMAGRNPDGTEKDTAPPEAPADSPWLAEGIVSSFDDAALLADYKRAVGYMSKGNARTARPTLVQLADAGADKGWAEPVAALLCDAKASVGEVAESRRSIEEFRVAWPSSSHMATIVVAEGKALMHEGKRARAPGQKRNSPPSAEQAELYRQAIARWDEAISKWPADPAVADAYLNKSALLIDLDDLGAAEQTAGAMATQFPEAENAPRALSNVGRAAMDRDQTEVAQRALQRLVDDFPRDRLARAARTQLSNLQLIGQEAPLLDVTEWIGDDLGQVSDHRGKVILLVFWSTWCPHCRREMPQIEETWQKYKDDDFVVIALTRNTRGQTTEKVREYATENGLTFPIAVDPGSTSRAYGVSGIPAAALIDKDGKVVFRNHPGQVNDEFLSKYL